MKGMKQLSIGLACVASLAIVGCHGRSTPVGYDAGFASANGYEAGLTRAANGYEAGLTVANTQALDMDSGMPPRADFKATAQSQTGATTSAWDSGLTQHTVAATTPGRR